MNIKKLNLGLVALLLGFGLVMTQSAFSPAKNAKTVLYGYDESITSGNPWVDLTGKSIENGDYTCDEPFLSTCVSEFTSPPDENTPQETNMVSNGVFVPNF